MERQGGVFYCDRAILYAPIFGICLTESDYLIEAKRLGEKSPGVWVAHGKSGMVHEFVTEDGSSQVCLVCINQTVLGQQGFDKDDVAGLLVHEAVHIWQKLAEGIGEHTPGKEQEAYGIERISTRLFVAYRKALKRYRKKTRRAKKPKPAANGAKRK